VGYLQCVGPVLFVCLNFVDLPRQNWQCCLCGCACPVHDLMHPCVLQLYGCVAQLSALRLALLPLLALPPLPLTTTTSTPHVQMAGMRAVVRALNTSAAAA
jgi:hypothetical protein